MIGLARGLLWLVASALVLMLGFALSLVGYYALARALGVVDDSQIRTVVTGLAIYYRLILCKGLLPVLLAALALWPVVGRLLPWFAGSRFRVLLGLALGAAAGYALVAPLLLTRSFEGWPALEMQGLSDQVGTALLLVGPAALSAWIPRLLFRAGRSQLQLADGGAEIGSPG